MADKKADTGLTMENYADIAESQIKIDKVTQEKREEKARFLTKYSFSEPLKSNTAITRKEKKEILKALKVFNDAEAEELFGGKNGDKDTLEKVKESKASLKIQLSDDQKEVIFDTLLKLRAIDEPTDLPLSEIFIYVDLVLGRTYNPELYEGN